MARRWDVMSARARKGQEKPYWHKIGAAFEGERGINLVLDSLPLPDAEGRVSVSLFEPRERQDQGQRGQQTHYKGQAGHLAGFDDDGPDDFSAPF